MNSNRPLRWYATYLWYQSDIIISSRASTNDSFPAWTTSTMKRHSYSEDRPSGEGSHDIWFSTSSDNGANWSVPENASSVNTAVQNHQPHLYNDGTDWWLYFSQPHSDGKLAIFRSRQTTASDRDSWTAPELIISAGITQGVGEPTVTDAGDLFFVAVLENPDGSPTDRFDADPWMARHK